MTPEQEAAVKLSREQEASALAVTFTDWTAPYADLIHESLRARSRMSEEELAGVIGDVLFTVGTEKPKAGAIAIARAIRAYLLGVTD